MEDNNNVHPVFQPIVNLLANLGSPADYEPNEKVDRLETLLLTFMDNQIKANEQFVRSMESLKEMIDIIHANHK